MFQVCFLWITEIHAVLSTEMCLSYGILQRISSYQKKLFLPFLSLHACVFVCDLNSWKFSSRHSVEHLKNHVSEVGDGWVGFAQNMFTHVRSLLFLSFPQGRYESNFSRSPCFSFDSRNCLQFSFTFLLCFCHFYLPAINLQCLMKNSIFDLLS